MNFEMDFTMEEYMRNDSGPMSMDELSGPMSIDELSGPMPMDELSGPMSIDELSGPMSIDELNVEPDLTPDQIGMRPYDDNDDEDTISYLSDIDSDDDEGNRYAMIYDIDDNHASIVRDLYYDFDKVNDNVLDRIVLYTIDQLPSMVSEEKTTETFECPICYEEKTVDVRVMPSCQHGYCKDCIIQHLNVFRQEHREATCAYCRDTYYCMEVLNPLVYEEVSQCIRNV